MQANIYRLDELLIRYGWLSIFVVILITIPLLSKIAHGFGLIIVCILIACPIVLLITGYKIRRKEQRILAIQRLLQHSPQIHVEQLTGNSEFSLADVKEAINVLNTKGLGYYTWNAQNNVIADGRLHSEFLTINQCPSCGAGINLKMNASLNKVPNCPYCNTAIPADTINQLKLDTLKFIASSNKTGNGDENRYSSRKKSFSLVTFLLLLIAFWPAALWYIYNHRAQLSGL